MNLTIDIEKKDKKKKAEEKYIIEDNEQGRFFPLPYHYIEYKETSDLGKDIQPVLEPQDNNPSISDQNNETSKKKYTKKERRDIVETVNKKTQGG